MRKMKSLVLAVMGLLCCMSVSAHDFEVDGIYYDITSQADNTVAVTYRGYDYSEYSNEYSGEVTIPESVTYNGNTYSVTCISFQAFQSCTSLTSIEIPNSVTSIVSRAFYGCSSLISVEIPNSVTSIGSEAFYNCRSLTSIVVAPNNPKYDSRDNCNAIIESESNTLIAGCSNTTIPNSVTSIGEWAFYCMNLASIEIPNSVTSIGNYAFNSCSRLTSVTIPNSVTSIGYCAFYGTAWYNNQPDGVIYAGKVLYTYKGTMPAKTSITIEDGTLSISPGAFQSCSSLTSVKIPNSVTSIGDNAFEYCSSLTSVKIPNSVTSIGEWAFYGCSSLISVEIGNSVTSIGTGAFSSCESLTSITIPNSVTSIGSSAFSGTAWYNNQPDGVIYAGKVLYKYKGTMPANTSITIEDGTVSISPYAFYECSSLTSVEIPNSVTSIGDNAFEYCSSLTSVKIPNSVTSIGGYAFYNCWNLTSVEIGNSVTSIGESAFWNCSSLTSVEIPNSVTSIGEWAFYGCKNLKKLISYAEVPPVCGSNVFNGVKTQECTLYVPYGAKTAYSEAKYWNEFTNIEELAPPHYELTYELTDGVAYDRTSTCLVNSVTYTRTLPNLHWNALYVPFELPYDVIANRYDVAYINDVNGYDTDDNGTIDDLAMEIIKIKGGTLKANYPYLIKAKTAADRTMSITVEGATLYAAEENSVRCSSVYQNYAVTGIYTKKTAEELAGKLAISTSGAWQPLAAGTALNPFRLYLSITNIDDSPLKVETSAMSRMRIVERGETTGVETITPAQQREDVIIDLSGRRVKQPVKGGVYIVNGKKQIF